MPVLTCFGNCSLWSENCYAFQNLDWNPNVSPKYGMVDFDSGEVLSVEIIFPGIQVFLCVFHREQPWLESSIKIETK